MGIYKSRLKALEDSFFKDAWQEVDKETYEALLSTKPENVRYEKKRKWNVESKIFVEYDVYYVHVDPEELNDEERTRYIQLTHFKMAAEQDKYRDELLKQLTQMQEQSNSYLNTIKKIQKFWVILLCVLLGGTALLYILLFTALAFKPTF